MEEWAPITPDKCTACGRYHPGWYEERNQDITDAYEMGISSTRLAKAYRLSEGYVREVITAELGRRAFLATWHKEDE